MNRHGPTVAGARVTRERVAGARVVRATALVCIGAVASLWTTVPAHAAGQRQGDAVVVAHPDSDRALGGGGSSTLFSLKLPDGASCPGDSANDDYRVQGFMVPATDDPGTLRYKSIQPEGEGRWGLFDEYTASYAQVLTAKRDAPGGPGRILNIPRFTFAVFPPGTLKPGRYRIGIACTLLNETVRYWDGEIMVTRDAGDQPSGVRWSVVGFTDSRRGIGSSTATVVFAASAIALVVAGLVITAIRIREARASRVSLAQGVPGKPVDRP